MSVNKVILVGNVGQTPQVRTVGENKVANFNLATTERFKDREETEWHSIAVWGKLAEVIEKYVDKGTQLYVEGRIKTERFKAQDGSDRTMVRIYASSVQLLGKKDGSSAPSQPSAPAARPQTTPMPYPTGTDDADLPF